MRLFTTAALSLALVATGGLVMPGVALAQKKKEEAPAGPKASQKFFKVAKPLQDLLAAQDFDGAQAMLPDAEAAVDGPDDTYFLGNFYIQIGVGKKDQHLQRIGLDKMLESGKVAADLAPRYEVEAGKLAQIEGDLPAARAHYNKSIAAGNAGSDPYLMLGESYFGEAYDNVDGNQLSPKGKELAIQGLPYLEKAIEIEEAKGAPAPSDWYERGMKMSVLAASPDQLAWAERAVSHASNSENWRLALRSLQDANPNLTRDENVDVLRLMRVSDALKDNYSYGEYAEAAWRLGLPGEVLALVDSGVAKGEIEQANYADLYNLAKDAAPKDKASLPATEADATKAENGRLAANTGNAYLAYGDFAKAAELFRVALDKGGVDTDQVNTRLGIALAQSGDAAGAEAAFAKVTGSSSQVRKDIAALWSIWAKQRG